MKKMWLSLLMLIPFGIMAQTKIFTITGKIGNWDNPASISLNYNNDGKPVIISSEVNKGIFKFQGPINHPVKGYLAMLYQGPGKMGAAHQLWIEPGNLTISSPDSLQKIIIKGSVLNTEDAALSVIKNKNNEQLKQWFDEHGRPENNTSEEYKIKYEKKMSEIEQANKKASINFIKTHPNSFLSLAELNISLSRGVPDVSVVEPLFNSLSAAIKKSPMGKDYQEKLKGWKLVDIGSVAPGFTQPDQNGKLVKLSDFKGKYVLLDFWASWCHPCRAENPNLIKQYNLYKDKGFEIVGVSLDGGNTDAKNAWLKAIKSDSIDIWTQVSDLKGSKENEAVRRFGVGSIPESFLIDPAGKIIAKSLRGESLNDKLREVFAGNGLSQNDVVIPATYEILNQKLFLDTAVRYGRLPNGFTYYIRKNTQPKDRVFFYLANKAGSILENDDQRGLAHFLEHMNFNGTTHFPKNELVNYLQKAGVRFGADINAYTSFDETVYQLPLPSDKPAVLDSGILIMRDWAQGATLETGEIEKETGVILEEKRIGKGAGERMQRHYLPVLLNQSRYAERLPIGTEEVLNKFKPETLRSFYTSWYRPNLQALIVVGDIDVNQVEQTIKEKFTDLKNPVNEQERFEYTVPLTGRNQFVIATDSEQQGIGVQVTFKHRAAALQTGGDFRDYIIRNLFNSMMADRIKELTSNKSNPPFITGGAGIGSFIGKLDIYSLSFRARQGEIETGFKALWQENERVKRYGFTLTELNRAKQAFLNRLESGVAELPTTYSQKFVNEYLEHFLKGTAQTGVKKELQLAQTFVPGITLADFNFLVKEYIKDVDRDVLITGPAKEEHLLPDEQTIERWMNEVAGSNITPYNDTYREIPFFNKTVIPGKITQHRALETIKATGWTLSNGARVIIKPTRFMADDISFSAVAPGGNSVYPDEDYPTAAYASLLLNIAGIGEMNTSEMTKYLGGKKVGLGVSISHYSAEMNGLSSVKELETFFQFLHLRFGKPRYDKASFEGNISNFLAGLANKSKSPEDEFYNVISETISNGNIRGKSADSAFYKSINLDRAYKIYNEVFGNAANFTFIFAGDIDTAVLKPLVEKYIASLPASGEKQTPKNLNMHPPAGQFTKTVYKGAEQKASVNLTFSGAYEYNETNNKILDALKEILQIKLLERLREQEGGVYSPNVLVITENIPEQRYRLRIKFDCNPDNVEKLIASALDEVNKLKATGPDEINIDKFKAEDRNQHELSLKENNYWVDYIKELVLNNKDLNTASDYENILNKATRESIKAAANKYLSGENLVRFILLPGKYKK